MTREELYVKFDTIFRGIYWPKIRTYQKIDPERNILEIQLVNGSKLTFVYVNDASWALYSDARTRGEFDG